MDKRIIGVIYPIPERFIDRFFDGNPKVFAKFLPRKSTKLVSGNLLILYGSRGSKTLVGEGIIEKLEFLTAQRVLQKYKDLLFLTAEELDSYVRTPQVNGKPRADPRDSRELLTLLLKPLKKYDRPIPCHERITTAGLYLTAESYRSIMEHKAT